MFSKASMILCALTVVATTAVAERVECRVTADNWVESPPWEPHSRESLNHGSEQQLVISGRNSFALLVFDVSSARGLRVEKALLRVRRKPDPAPLTMVGISTISGSGPLAENEMNYFFARKDQPWSYPGSDLADVTFGVGGSLYAYVKARDAGDGWYEIEVPPQIAIALVTGDQFGLMLTDEKGQTRTRHSIFSRESGDRPVLIVEGERAGSTPGSVRALPAPSAQALGRTSLRPGSAILHFGGAAAARYELRFSNSPITANNFNTATPVPRWMLDPLAPQPNPLAVSNSLHDEVNAVVEKLQPGSLYYFAARAVSATGQLGPVSALGSLRASARVWPSLPAKSASQPPAPAPTAGGVKVWSFSELHKVNPQTGALLEAGPIWPSDVKLTGARNEFVAFQVAVESETPVPDIAVTVAKPLFAECKLPAAIRKTGAMRLYREWMVPDDKDTSDSRPWYPDVLLPLNGPFSLPAADNRVPRQRVQPLFVDIYIPHDATPGVHRGSIEVRAGSLLHTIPVAVDVLPLALPDNLNFIVDLNAYGGVNSGYDIPRGTPAYRDLLHAYHRVAHLNRANLDILGYSHSGSTEPDQTPALAGEGARTKVVSWQDWDAHYGPLLSGSAFADLPRASVPVPIIYLPLFENWPGDLRKTYKWNIPERPKTLVEYQQLIARHALASGPIEEGFPLDYQERFSAVAREFAAHFRERNWKQTKYQIFFNDKYYYKDPTRSPNANGVSWWLLDEPNHHDDYRALSFFGWLSKRWLKDYPDVPMVFRTDISYVDFIRDQIPGSIDINCISQHFFTKNRYLMDHRNRFGKTYWNYATTNHPRETNVSMRAWCWRAWTTGADAIVPWNTVRGMEAWDRAEPLTVFYVGKKFGLNEPFESLRLKAFRRGQQDVEYMILLARKKGWDREAVARAVTQTLDLSEETRRQYEEDAGAVRFDRISDAELDNLRLRVAAALAK